METVETVELDSEDPTRPDARRVLDRYRLLRRLGSGGFGTVWLALDERLGREVAVKRIPVESGGADPAAQRAEREATAAARLAHPGIAALFEAGSDDEAFYLVSELVRGSTLAALLAEGALSDRDVLLIGVALCDALAHAHARGVVHRDVKPSNVLCPEAPEEVGGVAKLADFGVASIGGADALTRTGDVVGTLAYMAPEQAAGRGAGPAADVWALALVLHEALGGVNPVRGANAAATARNLTRPVPSLRRARRDLPPAAAQAIDAALALDPTVRAGLQELRAGLAAGLPHADDEPGAVAASPLEEATRRVRSVRERRIRPPEPWVDAGPEEEWARPARPVRTGGLGRVVAGAGAGGLAAALLGWLGPAPPAEPLVAGAAVAGAVALLPRLAWLAAAALAVAWAAAALPGAALVLAAAVAAVPLLAPRLPAGWSAPALAPALGALGAATAFPALAGQARRWRDRAALGALGAWWLVLAEPLTGERLLLGAPAGTAPRSGWEGSAGEALRGALEPVLTSPLVLLALLYAVAAVLLPVLVRGRHAAADLVGATAWAAALAAATGALAPDAPPRGLVLGAVLGAAAAVAARAVRGAT